MLPRFKVFPEKLKQFPNSPRALHLPHRMGTAQQHADHVRELVDQGIVAAVEPVTIVNIECPCGMVVASVEVKEGKDVDLNA